MLRLTRYEVVALAMDELGLMGERDFNDVTAGEIRSAVIAALEAEIAIRKALQ